MLEINIGEPQQRTVSSGVFRRQRGAIRHSQLITRIHRRVNSIGGSHVSPHQEITDILLLC
jgi:hypothetical protein